MRTTNYFCLLLDMFITRCSLLFYQITISDAKLISLSAGHIVCDENEKEFVITAGGYKKRKCKVTGCNKPCQLVKKHKEMCICHYKLKEKVVGYEEELYDKLIDIGFDGFRQPVLLSGVTSQCKPDLWKIESGRVGRIEIDSIVHTQQQYDHDPARIRGQRKIP